MEERKDQILRQLPDRSIEHASVVKGKDALFRENTLPAVAEAVSRRFQRQCGVADVCRRLTALKEKWQRIVKIKVISAASWDHATRTISMREDDYHHYAMVMTPCPFGLQHCITFNSLLNSFFFQQRLIRRTHGC